MFHRIQRACLFLLLASLVLADVPPNRQDISASANPSSRLEVTTDSRGGLSSSFNLALHDPSLAIAVTGGHPEISCPAALAWNQKYSKNITDNLTDEEREEKWIVSYMDQHPDETLWELFTRTLNEDVKNWRNGPHPTEAAADAVVKFTAELLQQFVLMIWAAFKWVVKFPFESRKEWKQVKDLGHELWDGTKIASSLFAENPINGLKTLTGGLFLHILLHPAEFTAESVLLVGAGFHVIHGLIHGIEAVAGSLPPLVGSAIMSVLMFLHALDDPLLILTPIFTSTAHSVQAIKSNAGSLGSCEQNGGFTSSDGTALITLPPATIIPSAPTCSLFPPDLGAPPLTYAKLCLTSDITQVRKIIFGTTKSSDAMSREERLEAYTHVRKFWCCYGQDASSIMPDSVLADVPGRESWEGKSFWKDLGDCQRFFDSKPRPQSGRLVLGL
ncbi:hypothetical protein O181_010416 [Austropuccinia psidii MF-1]|uniref:Uncharacterized protein n=1 Tax=Austropuccinia psidii MF-1 TaxID=1389203 RepID=A0A9Q3BR00_9BASI|nr:hypothetical protein [Austropuccinia psidii MF-1]